MKPLAPGRIRCLVPFCGRTFKRRPSGGDDEEIICGNHWRLADKQRRMLLRKVYRRWAKAPEERKPFLARMWWRLWEEIKAQAIERAMGA